MTAEELLMSEESEAFEYSNVITIDRESRAINVPLGQEEFGVEGDENVTLKHFTCPKIVGNNIEIDLSEHNLYANYTLSDEKGNPKSEDVIQSPCENIVIGDDNITFDWKISEWVTKEDGYIAFSIVAKKSVDGVVETKWYTTPAVGRILKTVKEGRYIEQQYPDVIDNLMNRVSDLERILANGGGSITVDDALSDTSTNPVQNKVVTKEIRQLYEEIADLFFETIADMQASDNLKVGLFIKTGGYYSKRDGGGCVYEVIAEKEKSYDIEGNSVAFRPIVNGVAYPKMFGTYNDGVTADNVPLQACFDYVADYGIATIDGANLTYHVNHSTDALTQQDHLHIYPNGITHHGVIIRTGVELRNYNSVLMPNTEIITPVLTLLQSETNSFHIHHCDLDGNYGNHEERPSGTGVDGGRHLLFFTYEDTMFPDDFRPCGDITIEYCKLHNPDSYPIMISACDCNYIVRHCDIKSHAMGVLTYATNCVVENCTFLTEDHYKEMAHPFCLDEIEFGSNYTGGKKKNIEIRNCKVNAPSVINVVQGPQVGVNYGTVKIIDCVNEYKNGDIYVDYVDTSKYDTRKTIDSIEIRGCITPNPPETTLTENISITGADIGRVVVEDTILTACRLGDCNVDKVIFKDLRNEWDFTIMNTGTAHLKEVELDNIVFNSSRVPIIYNVAGVENLKIRNCTNKNRVKIANASAEVTTLNIFIDNFRYEKLDEGYAGSFLDIGASGEYNITVKDSQFLTGWNTSNFIYVESGSTATGKIILQNILAVNLPIADGYLELVKMNVAFIGEITELVGIESIEQTTTSTEDGGNNVITVTLTNGKKETFTVKNGTKGDKGNDGSNYIITDSDKKEIADDVKAEVPLVKTAEQPIFVESVDEMTDTSKVYVNIENGFLYAYMSPEKHVLTANDFIAGAAQANGSIDTGSSSTFNRIATKALLPLTGQKISVNCPSPYQYFVYYYTGNTEDTYIGKTTWKSGNIDDVLADVIASGTIDGAKYCRISLRDNRNTSANLSSRIDEFVANIRITYKADVDKEWRNTKLSYNK